MHNQSATDLKYYYCKIVGPKFEHSMGNWNLWYWTGDSFMLKVPKILVQRISAYTPKRMCQWNGALYIYISKYVYLLIW